MSRLHILLVALAASAALLVSCYAEDGLLMWSEGDHQVADFPIINGEAPNAAYHEATVSLHELTRKGQVYVLPFCSGTLIAPDIILTAAHCLNTGTGSKVRTMKPSALAIYVGDDPQVDILDHLYFTSETLIHGGYNPYSLQHDIALVRLSAPITEAIEPVPYLDSSVGFTDADLGTVINFAGFGDDEFGNHGVKLQIDGTLGGFGCSVSGCGDSGYADSQISYSQPNAGPCFGDSGGPAFVFRGEDVYVGGITSYGDSTCSVYGVSTRTDAYDTFIDDFIGVPPEPPVCDADAWCNTECSYDPDCPEPPVCDADAWCNPECLDGEDPDCAEPSSCGDGVCGVGESCDGRYGTVACSDCAGKTNGKPSGRYCFVEGACEGPGCP
jgi:hypothetical protein